MNNKTTVIKLIKLKDGRVGSLGVGYGEGLINATYAVNSDLDGMERISIGVLYSLYQHSESMREAMIHMGLDLADDSVRVVDNDVVTDMGTNKLVKSFAGTLSFKEINPIHLLRKETLDKLHITPNRLVIGNYMRTQNITDNSASKYLSFIDSAIQRTMMTKGGYIKTPYKINEINNNLDELYLESFSNSSGLTPLDQLKALQGNRTCFIEITFTPILEVLNNMKHVEPDDTDVADRHGYYAFSNTPHDVYFIHNYRIQTMRNAYTTESDHVSLYKNGELISTWSLHEYNDCGFYVNLIDAKVALHTPDVETENKRILSLNKEIETLQKEHEKAIQLKDAQYRAQLKEQANILKDLEKEVKDLEKEVKAKDKEIDNLKSIIDKHDLHILKKDVYVTKSKKDLLNHEIKVKEEMKRRTEEAPSVMNTVSSFLDNTNAIVGGLILLVGGLYTLSTYRSED